MSRMSKGIPDAKVAALPGRTKCVTDCPASERAHPYIEPMMPAPTTRMFTALTSLADRDAAAFYEGAVVKRVGRRE